MRDAIGLVGGLDEHFFYAADVVAEGIVRFGADDFCGVQHGCSSWCVCVRAKKKPGPEDGAGRGRAEIAHRCYRPGLASLSPHNSQVQRTDTCWEVPCPSRAGGA